MNLESNLDGDTGLRRSAFFPSPGIRRCLTREWGPGPRALVIGCNPSDAAEDREDPTSRWWNEWFRLFGFGAYDAMNLWAKVSSNPKQCKCWADWQGNGPYWQARNEIVCHNLSALVAAAKRADQVFVCWGSIAWDHDWVEHVVKEIQSGEAPWPDLWCWGKTKSGAPIHPMARGKHRISKDQEPILWRQGHGSGSCL